MSRKSARRPAEVFGRRLREARERRGWTQDQLAKYAAVHRTTIVRLERAQTEPSLDVVLRCAAGLGVPPVHLIVPLEDEEDVKVAGFTLTAPEARDWIRGLRPIEGADPEAYLDLLLTMPDEEARRLLEGLYEKRLAGLPPLKRLFGSDPSLAREFSRTTMNKLREQRKEEEK